MGRLRKHPLYFSIDGHTSSDEEFDIIVDKPKRSKRSNSRERRQQSEEQQYQEQESLNLDLDTTNSQWEHVDDMAEQDYGYEDLLPKLKSAYLRGIARNPIDIQSLDTPAIPDCTCDAKYKRQQIVTCIFLCGVRKHNFQYCNYCTDEQRSLSVVLFEKHLFPTTPINKKIAIHIEVICHYHNMRLVGRVPINTIFELMKADYEKTILPLTLRNTLYQALVNYSKFKLLLNNDVNSLCSIQDRICPICSQMNRRRLTTNATDSYCEGWKSLSKTGSRNIFVPTTGVFAAICSRHDFVLGLMDMQTAGEKIEYLLSILNQVKETYGTNICIAYDVSCKLGKAIEYTEKVSDLKEAPLTIGAFHIYGHEASPFVIPTRYMTEFNRHLFLNLLVNHYHEQKFKALGRTILKKYKKANKILHKTNNQLIGYNVQSLQEEWNEYANSLHQTASSVLRSQRLGETDKVRYAVLAYDFINKLMHTRRTGHKHAITLSTQLSKALKKVTTAVNNYNSTVNESE
ncbi:hypothetical protein INT45_011872, partial [Circinella minor]